MPRNTFAWQVDVPNEVQRKSKVHETDGNFSAIRPRTIGQNRNRNRNRTERLLIFPQPLKCRKTSFAEPENPAAHIPDIRASIIASTFLERMSTGVFSIRRRNISNERFPLFKKNQVCKPGLLSQTFLGLIILLPTFLENDHSCEISKENLLCRAFCYPQNGFFSFSCNGGRFKLFIDKYPFENIFNRQKNSKD